MLCGLNIDIIVAGRVVSVGDGRQMNRRINPVLKNIRLALQLTQMPRNPMKFAVGKGRQKINVLHREPSIALVCAFPILPVAPVIKIFLLFIFPSL